MKYLSNDHKTVPMHKNNHNHKQCNKMEHSIMNMMENQWKPRQQHGQNFSMEGKAKQNKY